MAKKADSQTSGEKVKVLFEHELMRQFTIQQVIIVNMEYSVRWR